jgi:signal recognition particle subunit SRP54
MTLQERHLPKLLNGSRRLRIAKGSGTTVTEVNQLVQRFEQASKMMKTVAKGGVPQVPGVGPIGGVTYTGKKKPPASKKSKSGNPAKRAAENAALAAGAKAAGSGFGLGKGPLADGGPTEEELAALQKMLGR